MTDPVGAAMLTSMPKDIARRTWLHVGVVVALAISVWSARTNNQSELDRHSGMVLPQQGNLAARGGSPTVRRSYVRSEDDPSTSNDEANDQPLGHFGTLTLSVCNESSGNCY